MKLSADLYDADTNDRIGVATPEQIDASNRAEQRGENGIILITANGDVAPSGSWDAQQPGVRSAYTDSLDAWVSGASDTP